MRMRRWPSWVLVTLIPVSIVAALACVVAELPVLFVPGLVLVVLAVGAILLLSDRRHGRDASTSIAYRGPGSGWADSFVEQWSLLQCSWRWDGEKVRTTVRIAFQRLDGATRVTIDHLGLPAQDEAARSAEGWNSCLDRLVNP